jgi:hypothetical protein
MSERPFDKPNTDPAYRLVVTAFRNRSRQFIWQIVDDNRGTAPMQTSETIFRSMEDAYNAGQGALEYWRARMRRTAPAVDLAQPLAKQSARSAT